MKVGDKITFVPSAWSDVPGTYKNFEKYGVRKEVTGEIEFIHKKHHYFCVKYQAGNTVQRECFKYAEKEGQYENSINYKPQRWGG